MPGIIRCPSCGQEIDSNSRFCVNCSARICPGCHGPVPSRAVFCPNCGFAVGPAVPGTAEQQPAPTPPPGPPHPTPQGGIIGPQPRQQPSYPQAASPPTPGATPGTPIPQPIPSQQYGETDRQPGAYASSGSTPSISAQQPSVRAQKTFVDTGPIRVRRFPPALVIILIIAVIAIPVFAVFKTGLLEGPLSGIDLPEWLTFGSKDTTPPVISEVNISDITQTGAVITWKTDEPSTSQAMICDPGGGCTWTELDENLVTDHYVSVSNLKSDTNYHFTATSTDDNENQAIAEGDFKTLAQATTTTLVISAIETSNITEASATISWETDKSATTQLEYGTTNAYGSTTTIDETMTTSHSVTLTGLKPSTTYHFIVKSKDSSEEEVVSQDQTFSTLSTVPVTTETGPEVGKLAPDFTLPTLDGEQISLSDLRGKLVIVNFWQNVQQCRNELSLLQTIYDTWPQDTLEILAISWGQTQEIAQDVVDSKGLTFPILLDEAGEETTKYNVSRSPCNFFIDAQGVIRDIKCYPATLKTTTQIESILDSMQ